MRTSQVSSFKLIAGDRATTLCVSIVCLFPFLSLFAYITFLFYITSFFLGALTILEDGVATSAAVFANGVQKLDDEDLAGIFNNVGGKKHGDDAVRVYRTYLLFSVLLFVYITFHFYSDYT